MKEEMKEKEKMIANSLDEELINEIKYAESYWGNLGDITIVVKHSWDYLENDNWIHNEEINIKDIFRDNAGSLKIHSTNDRKKCERRISELNRNFIVPSWVFPRAFRDIYSEMKLQFKLTNNTEQLELLKNLFK